MAVNPKSIANLKPISKGDLSKEELKKRQVNGGNKSVAVKRANKTFKEAILIALERETILKDGNKGTTLESVVLAQIDKALIGDVQSATFIRDSIGQKPVDKQIQINTDTMSDQELDSMLEEAINILKNTKGD